MAQDGTGRDGGGQARQVSTSSVTVFLPNLLFSSSNFYYLFCPKLQKQMERGQVGRDRTELRGRRQQCGRNGGQAGKRRRWEKVGSRDAGEHGDS